MTEDIRPEKKETLGEFLQRLRKEKDLSFEEVLKRTRIPPKTLHAMEDDNYDALPADAFARGFYSLYAKSLGLDSQEILQRYDREHAGKQSVIGYSTPLHQEKQVNTMAARPSMAAASIVGFSLVVLIAAIALFSWYFSWNPATFISSKLQTFQESTTPVPQREETIATDLDGVKKKQTPLFDTNYFLTVDFLEDTTITISIDNGLPEKEVYTKGSTRSWYANKSISLILPESAKVDLFFNGNELALPSPQGELIIINLP